MCQNTDPSHCRDVPKGVAMDWLAIIHNSAVELDPFSWANWLGGGKCAGCSAAA